MKDSISENTDSTKTDPLSDEAFHAWRKNHEWVSSFMAWQEASRRALIETDGLEARIKNDAEEIKRLRELLLKFIDAAHNEPNLEYIWDVVSEAREALEGKE